MNLIQNLERRRETPLLRTQNLLQELISPVLQLTAMKLYPDWTTPIIRAI